MTDVTVRDPENLSWKETNGEAVQGCFVFTSLMFAGSAFHALIFWLIWNVWNLGAHLWPTLPERLASPSFLDVWGLIFCVRVFTYREKNTEIRRPKKEKA